MIVLLLFIDNIVVRRQGNTIFKNQKDLDAFQEEQFKKKSQSSGVNVTELKLSSTLEKHTELTEL